MKILIKAKQKSKYIAALQISGCMRTGMEVEINAKEEEKTYRDDGTFLLPRSYSDSLVESKQIHLTLHLKWVKVSESV